MERLSDDDRDSLGRIGELKRLDELPARKQVARRAVADDIREDARVLCVRRGFQAEKLEVDVPGRICVSHPCVLRLETTRTTGKNNFERGAWANSPALFSSSAYRLRWIFDMIAPSQP